MTCRIGYWLMAVTIGVLGWSGSAQATFSSVTFFGDDYSDTGNVLSLTTIFEPPPFPNFSAAPGRFSNGPVWAESFAGALGFPAASSNSNLIFNGSSAVPIGSLGGQNFAFGGARTGLGGSVGATTGLFGQLIAWNGSLFAGSLTRAADPNGLYVVLAGMNDMRDFRSGLPGGNQPSAAAINVVNSIALLAQAGAQHFLISNLPDLGLTPEAVGLGLVPQSTVASLAFNAALAAALTLLDAEFLGATGIDLDIRTLDLFGLSQAIFDDATNHGGAKYGITNVTTPCIAPNPFGVYFAPDSTDINCAVSEFADTLNPSALTHRAISELALAAVDANVVAVPEPSSLVLVAAALGILARKRRHATPMRSLRMNSRLCSRALGSLR
jgi:phospholipase/lecithinase/hemolysin